jgi:hypothetical protein
MTKVSKRKIGHTKIKEHVLFVEKKNIAKF